MLRERDIPGGTYIGLVDSNVRYCLDHGDHVLLEGILATSRCQDVLAPKTES